jgi:hypothetical protein
MLAICLVARLMNSPVAGLEYTNAPLGLNTTHPAYRLMTYLFWE